MRSANCSSLGAARSKSGYCRAFRMISHSGTPRSVASAWARATVVPPMPRGGLLMIRTRRRLSWGLFTTLR